MPFTFIGNHSVSLDLKILEGLDEIKTRISSLEKKAIPSAVRKSLNSAGKFIQTRSIEEIVKVRKLKKSKLKKDYLEIKKYLRGSWTDFAVVFRVLAKPIPLLEFIKGAKTPRKQKGKKSRGGKYPGRGRLKAEIVPGMAAKPEGIFIAKSKSGKMRVFRRHPDSKSKGSRRQRSSPRIVTQNTPSLTTFFKNERWIRPTLDKTGAYMQKEFLRVLKALFK